MEIRSFESLPSTQRWLTEAIRRGEVTAPVAVIAERQTDGIGSRENRWIGHPGNFFASIALRQSDLPEDLPPSAASIYFAFLIQINSYRIISLLFLIPFKNIKLTENIKVKRLV